MSNTERTTYFIGVDVGTGSTRAALFTKKGDIVKLSTYPIKTWNPKPEYFNQSSEDIWLACNKAIMVSRYSLLLIWITYYRN